MLAIPLQPVFCSIAHVFQLLRVQTVLFVIPVYQPVLLLFGLLLLWTTDFPCHCSAVDTKHTPSATRKKEMCKRAAVNYVLKGGIRLLSFRLSSKTILKATLAELPRDGLEHILFKFPCTCRYSLQLKQHRTVLNKIYTLPVFGSWTLHYSCFIKTCKNSLPAAKAPKVICSCRGWQKRFPASTEAGMNIGLGL